MRKVIVFNDRAGMITMFATVEGVSRSFTFMPGKNEIALPLWEEIRKQNQEDFTNHYSTILREFRPRDEKGDSVQVDPEKRIDITRLSAQDASDLVNNTTESEELLDYLQAEKGRDKPRKPIIKAIEMKMEEHTDFNKRLEEVNRIS